jgi:hypothetical protein
METALAIVNLMNAASPGMAQLILLIKDNNGKYTVATFLDQADSQYEANIKQIADWKASQKTGG